MIEEHYFKAGDLVPEWVAVLSPSYLQSEFRFLVDVLVEKTAGGAICYPMKELAAGEGLMKIDGKGEKVHMNGAPLTFFAFPKGDDRNNNIIDIAGIAYP